MKIPYDVLHQPKNTMPKITEIWAVLSVDEGDGNEGVCAVSVGDAMMPLIAADESRAAWIRERGRHLTTIAGRGQVIKLVKFSNREEVEIL